MPVNNYTPRISIVTGVVNSHDAVSETVIADLEALDKLSRRYRRNLDIRVFCMESNHPDTRIRVLSDWRDALSDDHFATSDLFYFHFAIHNDIHNLMYRLRRDAKSVVFFHNVTPPQFCPPKDEKLIHSSYQQMRNFRTADLILTPSNFSAQQLSGYRLGKDVRIVPLFGANGPEDVAPTSADPHEGPLRLLYCGRFVPSKGVETLLGALDQISGKLARPVELTLAGSRQFSDSQYLGRLQEAAAQLSGDVTTQFLFDLDSSAIKTLFAGADAFVLPSFHEGFGMPVAEALMAGTPVICSTAGALPEIAGGCALTVPPGDARALGKSLCAFVEEWGKGNVLSDHGVLKRAAWDERRAAHAKTLLRASYIDRIGAEFDALLQPTTSWSAEARQALRDAQLIASDQVLPDPIDSAVIGNLLGQRTLRAVEDGATAMRRVLSIAFSWVQSDQDVDYWLNLLPESGVNGVVRRLVNAPELRHSRARLQASVFFRAQLVADDIDGMLAKKARKEKDDARDYARAKLNLLAQNVNLSDAEFLRDAVSLMGIVDTDDERVADLSEQLARGAISRIEASDVLARLSLSDGAPEEASPIGFEMPASWRPRRRQESIAAPANDHWGSASHRDTDTSPEVAQLIADLRYAKFEAEALKRQIASRQLSERLLLRPLRDASNFTRFAAGMIGPARKYIKQGDQARDRQDWETAARNYALAVQAAPSLGHIWIQLGHMRKEMRDMEEARAAYERALTLLPFNSDAHLQMGHLHNIMGDQKTALDHYWKSFFLDPANDNAVRQLRGMGFAEEIKRVADRIKSRC